MGTIQIVLKILLKLIKQKMKYLKFHIRVRFHLSRWYILKSGRPDYSETALSSYYTMIFHVIFVWKITNYVHWRFLTTRKVSSKFAKVLVINFQSFLTT